MIYIYILYIYIYVVYVYVYIVYVYIVYVYSIWSVDVYCIHTQTFVKCLVQIWHTNLQKVRLYYALNLSLLVWLAHLVPFAGTIYPTRYPTSSGSPSPHHMFASIWHP